MNWNDYEAIWKRQELPLGTTADVENLRQTFEAKRRKTEKALFARDTLEGFAGLLVAGTCGLIWWQQGKAGWPIGFAITLILGVTAVFVRERLRTRRSRIGPDKPLLVKVEAQIAELRHQRELLSHLWWWYLGPCAAVIVIVWFTLVRNLPSWSPMKEPLMIAFFGAFFSLCLGFAWFINHRATRKQLDPRIVELEKLRDDLLR